MFTSQPKRTFINMQEVMQLTRKSILSSIAFQLFFDIIYVFLFIACARILFYLSMDFFDHATSYFRINNTLAHIPYLSFINFHVIFSLGFLVLILAFFYMVETHALLIITSLHYRNTPISSFRAFLRACIKTPYVIKFRIIQLRKHFYILAGLYISWKMIVQIYPHMPFSHWISTGTFLYFVLIILSIIFRYTTSAYVICLEHDESPFNFDDHVPFVTQVKRIHTFVMFYLFLFLAVLIWLLAFSFILKGLVILSHNYPSFISHILTLFVSGTIISIFLFLSLLKTVRINMQTIAYHEERRAHHKTIPHMSSIQPSEKRKAMIIIEIVATVTMGLSIISFTIYPKVSQLVLYAERSSQKNMISPLSNIPHSEAELSDYLFAKNHTTIDLIENIVLSYISVFIQNTRK